MEIQGTIHKIYHAERISEKFTKREFILLTQDNPMYPQYIKYVSRVDLHEKFNRIRR